MLNVRKSTATDDARRSVEAFRAGHYLPYRPSLKKRIWSWLGFKSVIVQLPDGIKATHPGWMVTKTRMQFSLGDRLRILASGRLLLSLQQATNPQVDDAVNAMSHQILHPGEEW